MNKSRKILCLMLVVLGLFQTTNLWAYWGENDDDNVKYGPMTFVDGVYYVLYDNNEYSIGLGGSKDFPLIGPADNLTFEAKRSTAGIGPLKVTQYVANAYGNDIFSQNPSTSYSKYGGYVLNNNATKIKFYTELGASLTKYFRNIKVTMATYCEAKESSIDFDPNEYLNAENKQIRIYWSNIDDAKIILENNSDDQFTIDKTSVGEAGCYGNNVLTITYKRTKVGTHTAKLVIKYKEYSKEYPITGTTTQAEVEVNIDKKPKASALEPQVEISNSTIIDPGEVKRVSTGEGIEGTWSWENGALLSDCYKKYNVTFTPSDPGYKSITCNIEIPIIQINQSIDWKVSQYQKEGEGETEVFLMEGDDDFEATAGVGVDVYFKSSDETVAIIEGNNHIHWLKSTYEVTITAYADEDCNYFAADSISRTFMLKLTIPDKIEPPTADAIDYGQTLSDSEIHDGAVYANGNLLTGTWSWVYPNLMPEIGTDKQLVTFNPDDPAYATTTVEVEVEVKKLLPQISWSAGEKGSEYRYIVRENSSYFKPVSSTNKEQSVEIDCNNSDLVTFDATSNCLRVSALAEDLTSQEVTIYVRQNGDFEGSHYESVEYTYTLLILKKSNVCLNQVQTDDECYADFSLSETYENALVTNEKSSWCNTNEKGRRNNYIFNIDVEYTQRNGIALGSWEDGFDVNLTARDLLEIIISGEFRYSTKYVELSFTGIPKGISLTTSTQTVTTIGNLLGVDIKNDFNATAAKWTLYESATGADGTWEKVTSWTSAKDTKDIINENLKVDTRFVKIEYSGNFTGFVENMKITRRHGFEVYEGDANEENKDEKLWKPLTEYSLPAFGEGKHALQAPQSLPIRYYSIGECGQTADESNEITITTDNDYFYANTEASELVKILRNVDFDQWGETSITIRNTGINANGSVLLKGSNGDQLTINVSAAKPAITADKTNDQLFLTGTEQSRQISDSPYRGLEEYDFSLCFGSDNQPLFDSLYIFGVTGNTEEVLQKFDYFDPHQMMWLPKLNTPNETTACNAHTPLFIYQSDGTKYTWARTIDNVSAEGLQEMQAGSQKLAFLGYCPYAYNGYGDHEGFIHFISDGTKHTDITLFNTEIGARPHTQDGTTAESGYQASTTIPLKEGDNGIKGSGSIFSFSNTSKDKPYDVTFHIYGNNTLRSTRGADINGSFGTDINGTFDNSKSFTLRQSSAPIMVNASSSNEQVNLIFDDLYNETHIIESSLTLISAEDIGVIDLGNEKSTLTIEGGIFNMVNSGKPLSPLAVSYQRTLLESKGRYAILYGPGEDQTDAKVFIKDGTIVDDDPDNETDQNAIIRMPWNTEITGGTFWNDIKCYQVLGGEAGRPITGRPINNKGIEVNWYEGMTESAVRAKESEYGMNSVVTDDDGKLFPMLPDEEQKEREDQINIWMAAMPDAVTEVSKVNTHLLYMETAAGLFESQNGNQYQTINRKENYTVNGTMSMLMQIDRADRWRTFVAPFDIKRVYVLGLAVEDGLDYDTKEGREELISRHKAAAKDFQSYLQSYIMPQTGSATLLPFGALLSKYVSENNIDSALYLLEHYDGTNFRTANYDLYKLPQPEEWMVQNDAFQARWNYVKAKSDGSEIIMKRDSTYILNFGYCPTCKDEYHDNHYDYWTGKFILFEGTIANGESYELIGTDKALSTIMETSSQASKEKAVFSGNASFGEVTLTNDVQAPVYIFNPISDFYEKPSSVLPLRPTESVLMYSSSVAPVLRISRNGEIIYGDIQGGTTTDIDYNYEKSECSECSDFETVRAIKVIEDGKVYILQGGHKYTLTGQLVQ